MKIYIPNNSKTAIGGGFRFLENLRKGLEGKVKVVDRWQDADIVFVFSVTTMDKGEIYEAKKAGKKLVLRCDNIPKKSRNKRCSPVERLTEFGALADLVVYQSEWCKMYAGYFIKNENEVIINNGVDTKIFNTEGRNSDGNTYLYINYNDNPNKRFDEALYWFDLEWRKNNNAHLIIAGNAPRVYLEQPDANWDLPVPARVDFEDVCHTPESVADLMRRCDFLLYPSAMEAYPNTLLEAMACGVKPLCINEIGGSIEAYMDSNIVISYCDDCGKIYTEEESNNFKVKTIQEMADEYILNFNKLI